MPRYKVNEAAVAKARKLIDGGRYDTETQWSEAAPSAEDGSHMIEVNGYDGYGEWFLGIDTAESEETKARYGFPYGDFSKVNRAALIHAKQRAAQNGHSQVEHAAGELLDQLDRAAAG